MRSIALSMRFLDRRNVVMVRGVILTASNDNDVITLTEADMFDVRVIQPVMPLAYRNAMRHIVLGRATATSWAFRKRLAASF